MLLQRCPDAQVLALDSDPDMIDKARQRPRLSIPRVRCEIGEIGSWTAHEPQDLILANASLQWVPDHASLFIAAGICGLIDIQLANPQFDIAAAGDQLLDLIEHALSAGPTPAGEPR